MNKLILGMLLLSSCGYAEDATLLHFSAHAGISYALTTAVYGFTEKVLMCDRTESFIFAAVVTTMIGAAYKMTEISPGDSQWPASFGRAVMFNTAGILAAGITINVFNF